MQTGEILLKGEEAVGEKNSVANTGRDSRQARSAMWQFGTNSAFVIGPKKTT